MGKRCTFFSLCFHIEKLLIKEGIPKEIIIQCSGHLPEVDSYPCTQMVHNVKLLYEASPSDNSKEVLALINEAFGDEVSTLQSFHPKLSVRNKFYCPELRIDMFQACCVNSCVYHTETEVANNCILFYFIKQERAALSFNELTMLTRKDTATLRSRINSILKSMRQKITKQALFEEKHSDFFLRLPTKKVCVSCEAKTPSPTMKKGFPYCSTLCAESLPPELIKMEALFNLSSFTVISYCASKFSSLNHVSSATGLSQPFLRDYCRRYQIQLKG